MVGKENILSFDEAKKSTANTRSSSAASRNPSQKNAPRSGARSQVKSTSRSTGTSTKSTQTKNASSPKKAKAGSAKETTSSKQAVQATRGAKGSSSTKSNVSTRSKDDSRVTLAKKNKAKKKAGKKFTKQFGDTSSAASSSGPRAAVYKGEMGRTHKKSSRMQNEASAKRVPSRGSTLRSSRKFVASVMIVVCLVASGAFLYPAAQQYYVAMRMHDQVEAEYQAVKQRTDSIQSQVDKLSTDEGVEDRVRQEYGWVKEGEHAVNVYGLDQESEEINYKKSIPGGSVPAPETWYSPILDVIFGVE